MTEHDLKRELQRELEELSAMRDQLRVRMHLAKADAKDEWHKLEDRWARLSGEVARTVHDAKKPAAEVGSAARSLLDELRRSYERIKGELLI
jgi:hypothetical protein